MHSLLNANVIQHSREVITFSNKPENIIFQSALQKLNMHDYLVMTEKQVLMR